MRLLRHYWWWLMEMLEAEEYFFSPLRPSSRFPSLTFSVMIAPRSISLLQPPPFTIMALTVFFHCLSFLLCLYSLPQPAQIYRAAFGSARDMLAKRKVMVFYNCSSPMLTARAAKVTHSVWLSHVHRAPQHFVFIMEHATHTHTQTHLISFRVAFPVNVQQNDPTYRHDCKISQQTEVEIILLGCESFFFLWFQNPVDWG